MSAADVLAVATPSWKTKGLRSANDLEASDSTTVCSADAFAVDDDDDSDFVIDSLAAFVLVLRRIPSVGARDDRQGDLLLEEITNRRDSMLEANIFC